MRTPRTHPGASPSCIYSVGWSWLNSAPAMYRRATYPNRWSTKLEKLTPTATICGYDRWIAGQPAVEIFAPRPDLKSASCRSTIGEYKLVPPYQLEKLAAGSGTHPAGPAVLLLMRRARCRRSPDFHAISRCRATRSRIVTLESAGRPPSRRCRSARRRPAEREPRAGLRELRCPGPPAPPWHQPCRPRSRRG